MCVFVHITYKHFYTYTCRNMICTYIYIYMYIHARCNADDKKTVGLLIVEMISNTFLDFHFWGCYVGTYHIRVCIRMRAWGCLFQCAASYEHMCICICVCVFTYTHTNTYTHIPRRNMRCIYMYTHSHAFTYTLWNCGTNTQDCNAGDKKTVGLLIVEMISNTFLDFHFEATVLKISHECALDTRFVFIEVRVWIWKHLYTYTYTYAFVYIHTYRRLSEAAAVAHTLIYM